MASPKSASAKGRAKDSAGRSVARPEDCHYGVYLNSASELYRVVDAMPGFKDDNGARHHAQVCIETCRTNECEWIPLPKFLKMGLTVLRK